MLRTMAGLRNGLCSVGRTFLISVSSHEDNGRTRKQWLCVKPAGD